MTNNQKLVRIVVRMPSELIERIDAHRFGESYDPVVTVAGLDRKPGSITLLLPQETIELLDAFRAAHGLKTRAAAIIRLIEGGLKLDGVVKAKLN